MYLFNQVDFFILNYAGIIILMSRILALQVSLYPKKKTYQFCYIVIQIHCTKRKGRLPTERSRGPSPGGLGDMHAYKYFPLGPCPFSAVSPVFHFQSINWGKVEEIEVRWNVKDESREKNDRGSRTFIFIRMSSSIHQYMWSFGWLGLISTEFLNATFKSFTSSLLAPSHFK